MSDKFTHMSTYPVKLVDNGDSTYSLAVSGNSNLITTIATTVTNSNISVAVSNTTILSSSSRTFMALTNNGAYDVWIAFGAAAVLNKGMLLSAYGGSVVMDKSSIYQGNVFGIAETTGTTIAYVEGVE